MIKKISKILLGIVLSLLLGYAFLYIQQNKYFWFATGTRNKAILNTTWKMSPQEISRVNKTYLVKSDRLILFAPDVVDQKRIKKLVQKDVFLWGHRTEIVYVFFDEMLYEYYIGITLYDKDIYIDDIMKALKTKYGKPQDRNKHSDNCLYSFDFKSRNQLISTWLIENDNKTFHAGIRANYLPFKNEVEHIIQEEKSNYF